MRSLFTLILACTLTAAATAARADDCSDLAKRFAADRDALKIGELDDLKSCISDLEADKASGLVKSEQPAYANAPTGKQKGGSGASTGSSATPDPVSQPVGEGASDPVSQPIPGSGSQPASPAGASQ